MGNGANNPQRLPIDQIATGWIGALSLRYLDIKFSLQLIQDILLTDDIRRIPFLIAIEGHKLNKTQFYSLMLCPFHQRNNLIVIDAFDEHTIDLDGQTCLLCGRNTLKYRL